MARKKQICPKCGGLMSGQAPQCWNCYVEGKKIARLKRRVCPLCGGPKHRQEKRCHKCAMADPLVRSHLSEVRKGKPSYVRTPEWCKAMSARKKGKKHHWPSGSTRPEVAEKIRQWWTPERREAARLKGLTQASDPEWRLRCGFPGEKNPMWENGKSQIPYARGWARKVKQLAWQRANHHCEICGSDKPHDTHHIDFHKDNHDLDNLQVLCRKCHKKLHVENLKNNSPRHS